MCPVCSHVRVHIGWLERCIIASEGSGVAIPVEVQPAISVTIHSIDSSNAGCIRICMNGFVKRKWPCSGGPIQRSVEISLKTSRAVLYPVAVSINVSIFYRKHFVPILICACCIASTTALKVTCDLSAGAFVKARGH